MIFSLEGLNFERACAMLETNGCRHIAEGDWAAVYEVPGVGSVIRVTPYDPAYLLFVHICLACPHLCLPSPRAVVRLAGSGYAVEMPRYAVAEPSLCAGFVAELKAAMELESCSSQQAGNDDLISLAQILKRGVAAGEIFVPYFGGMDWNLENVLRNGATPILTDGFYQKGALITAAIADGSPLKLSQAELEGFQAIPFHRRAREQAAAK